MNRSEWLADYWAGRPKVDDDGNDVPTSQTQSLVDEGGVIEELQEITGYESNDTPHEKPIPEAIDYNEDWDCISRDLKNLRGWRCEVCGFSSHGSSAIQTHHINHDKSDNGIANLQVLCATCHGNKHGMGTGMSELTSTDNRAELDAGHKAKTMIKNGPRRNR